MEEEQVMVAASAGEMIAIINLMSALFYALEEVSTLAQKRTRTVSEFVDTNVMRRVLNSIRERCGPLAENIDHEDWFGDEVARDILHWELGQCLHGNLDCQISGLRGVVGGSEEPLIIDDALNRWIDTFRIPGSQRVAPVTAGLGR
jgi:hypothetical protein